MALKLFAYLPNLQKFIQLGGLESINSQPTDEVKCAFVNTRVLIHESQPNFFRGV